MSVIPSTATDPRQLAADLRERINHAYAHVLGTESHERLLCAEAIESLLEQRYELKPLPLAECTVEDLVDNHAFVYGRCKIWHAGPAGTGAPKFHWSKTAWWTALWYSNRGLPEFSGNWGAYTNCGSLGYSGPGDAELTHFMRMPKVNP